MRIRVKSSRRQTQRITLSLASMIDVTFLLLAYFIVTSARAHEDKLSPNIQTQQQAQGTPSDFQPQIVRVAIEAGSPVYRLGERIMTDKEQLREALRGLHKETGVFVHVADGVPIGFAVAGIQAARDAGFEQVTYVPAD